jgi:hypothetical protein
MDGQGEICGRTAGALRSGILTRDGVKIFIDRGCNDIPFQRRLIINVFLIIGVGVL